VLVPCGRGLAGRCAKQCAHCCRNRRYTVRRQRRDPEAESKRRKTIGTKEIEAVIAKIARIPPKNVSKNDAEVLIAKNKDMDPHDIRQNGRKMYEKPARFLDL